MSADSTVGVCQQLVGSKCSCAWGGGGYILKTAAPHTHYTELKERPKRDI